MGIFLHGEWELERNNVEIDVNEDLKKFALKNVHHRVDENIFCVQQRGMKKQKEK